MLFYKSLKTHIFLFSKTPGIPENFPKIPKKFYAIANKGLKNLGKVLKYYVYRRINYDNH